MSKPYKLLRYEQVRDTLKTGDLVFFKSSGFIPWLIMLFSNYSHVGIVYKTVDDVIFLFESTSIRSGGLNGVQFNSLRAIVAQAKRRDKIYVRRLNKSLTYRQKNIFLSVRKTVAWRPYERNLVQLAMAGLDKYLPSWLSIRTKSNMKSIFCSELVAHCLQAMGIMSRKKKPHTYSPEDLGGRNPDLIDGYKYEAVTKISI